MLTDISLSTFYGTLLLVWKITVITVKTIEKNSVNCNCHEKDRTGVIIFLENFFDLHCQFS